MTLAPDLQEVLNDLRPATRRAAAIRASRRRRRAIGVTALLAACVTGSAVAAFAILGRPAPEPIAANIHRSALVLFGTHRELVASTAKVLAESDDATLYGVSDKSGAYCVELVGARRGLVFSFSCDEGIKVGNAFLLPGSAALDTYFVTIKGVEPPVVWWGRLASGTTSARAEYPDGSSETIPTGLDGFFVYQPADQSLARRLPVTIQFLDKSGNPSFSSDVLPPQPLETSGASSVSVPGGAHFDQPALISGHVLIDHAAKIEVQSFRGRRSPDTRFITLNADGRFTFAPSKEAFGSMLYVDDAEGRHLTEMIFPVAPTFWEPIVEQARNP